MNTDMITHDTLKRRNFGIFFWLARGGTWDYGMGRDQWA